MIKKIKYALFICFSNMLYASENQDMYRLERMDLFGNVIGYRLDLSNKNLANMQDLAAIHNIAMVRWLSLCNNNITEIPKDIDSFFEKHPKLQTINLYGNPVTKSLPKDFLNNPYYRPEP